MSRSSRGAAGDRSLRARTGRRKRPAASRPASDAALPAWLPGPPTPSPVARVIDPPPRRPEHQDGESEDDQEEDPGERGRVAQPEVADRVVVEVEAVEEERVLQPA